MWPSDSVQLQGHLYCLLFFEEAICEECHLPCDPSDGGDDNCVPMHHKCKKRKDVGPSEEQLFPSSTATNNPRITDQYIYIIPGSGLHQNLPLKG